MNELYINSQFGNTDNYFISLDDVNVEDIKDNDTIVCEIYNKLFFEKYYYDGYGGLIVKNMNGYNALFSSKNLLVKSDSIDVKEGDILITTLTLIGLKRKDNGQRDFVGEIACYQNELIKVDRTNADKPTIQFLSFENSQYKDNYQREERMKLLYIPFDTL